MKIHQILTLLPVATVCERTASSLKTQVLLTAVLGAVLSLSTVAQAAKVTDATSDVAVSASDQALLQMHAAFQKQDSRTLAALLPSVQGHPLQVWGHYWELNARLPQATAQEVDDFLHRWQGTYQEDRLRNDWLLLLGQRRQWSEFERLHADFRMRDDPQVKCYALALSALNGQFATTAAIPRMLHMWYRQPNHDDGCNYAAQEFFALGHIGQLDVWKRARIGSELNRQTATRNAVTIIAPQYASQVTAIFKTPAGYLKAARMPEGAAKRKSGKSAQSVPTVSPPKDASLGPGKVSDSTRQLLTLALVRLSARDPDAAARELQTHWTSILHDEERDWAWGTIGRFAAGALSADAPRWFDRVKNPAGLSDDTLGWMARAYLRSGQWAGVKRAIGAMSPAAQASDTWTYWKARALMATYPGDTARITQAQYLLKNLASANHYYGQLALEALGQSIAVPEEPEPLTAEEIHQAQTNMGLTRALHAIRIGLRGPGVREWNYTTNLHTLGGMDDRALLAAADRACQAEVWDRCINTSERTRSFASWNQRYPMPFRDNVLAQSSLIGLENAYVYGLIRQESRFILDAHSHAGASGLMQVMPATARWTARKIGMTDFHTAMLKDQNTNIALGTTYLKLTLDDMDGSMVLAAAGYNAGPNRPRRWRNGPTLEGAIWAENIPFTETRDYVKKVLANTTSYAAILSGQPQSITERLGTVGPKTSTTPDADLP